MFFFQLFLCVHRQFEIVAVIFDCVSLLLLFCFAGLRRSPVVFAQSISFVCKNLAICCDFKVKRLRFAVYCFIINKSYIMIFRSQDVQTS